MQRLGAEAPYITLHHQSTEADPVEMLNSGRVDLVLEPREYLAPGFPSQVLLQDRWVCAVGVGPSVPTSTAELHYRRLDVGGRVTTTINSFAPLPFLLHGTRLFALAQEKLATTHQLRA